MKKKGPVLWFSVYMGDEIVPCCVGNHYACIYKDPYKTTRIQWKVRPVLFRGSVVQQLRPEHNTLTILEELVGSSQNFSSVSTFPILHFFCEDFPQP